MKYICIDIGGTSIKYGVATSEGILLETHERPTEAQQGEPGIMQKIEEIVNNFLQKYEIAGVAISTAGMVDPEKGCIVYSLEEAIPNYTNTQIKETIESKFGITTTVENDVNCAGLGEMWQAANVANKTIFCLTVGTSIGGCVIHDGKLISGASYSAGEIAYMKIPQGRLHDLVSTTKLVQEVATHKNLPLSEVNGKVVFDWAMNNNDKIAISSIKSLMDNLAEGLANVVSVLNPHIIILGGGIMANEEYLRPLLEEALQKRLVPRVFAHTKILFARLGNNAGMLGALYNFIQRNPR